MNRLTTDHTKNTEEQFQKTKEVSWTGVILGVLVGMFCMYYARRVAATDGEIWIAVIVLCSSVLLIARSALMLLGLIIGRMMQKEIYGNNRK